MYTLKNIAWHGLAPEFSAVTINGGILNEGLCFECHCVSRGTHVQFEMKDVGRIISSFYCSSKYLVSSAILLSLQDSDQTKSGDW